VMAFRILKLDISCPEDVVLMVFMEFSAAIGNLASDYCQRVFSTVNHARRNFSWDYLFY
jgi:hypothetical protein